MQWPDYPWTHGTALSTAASSCLHAGLGSANWGADQLQREDTHFTLPASHRPAQAPGLSGSLLTPSDPPTPLECALCFLLGLTAIPTTYNYFSQFNDT